MAGRNIFRATSPRKFQGVLKPMPPPPSLSASKQQKIFKPIPPLLILLHPRDRLPQPAPRVTLENSRRLFIIRDKFNLKVNQIGDDLEKIKEFALLCRVTNQKLIDKNYVCGDIKIFSDFLFQFVIKEFVDPRGYLNGYVHKCRWNFSFCLIFIENKKICFLKF